MTFSMYDASVPICAPQLGALANVIDKAAAHCAANKIEEAALLSDRLYPDMFCLARQIRQAADFGRNTPGRLAGVAGPEFAAVDDTSFAQANKRVEDSLAFVKTLQDEVRDLRSRMESLEHERSAYRSWAHTLWSHIHSAEPRTPAPQWPTDLPR